jgi:putative DNA primase/helicase
MWQWIKLLPFTTRIAPEKQDKHLEEKLLQERPGILNWLIEGVRRWFTEGLILPPEISNATDEYRDEMDALGNFIGECCIQSPEATIRARELFKGYQEWCEENNEHACSERFLSVRLKELGLERYRTAEARYWKGIMLKGDS